MQGEPGRVNQGGYFHVAANYQLMIDNLLDLSHEAYLHPATIGNAAVSEVPATTRVAGDSVEVERHMPNCQPPEMFVRAANFTTHIDRYQRIIFTPPCFVAIEVRATPTGTPDLARGLEWWVTHATVPESATTSHYFWGLSRSFACGDAELTKMLQMGSERTLGEDKVMLEAQQRVLLNASLDDRGIYTAGDVAPARARQINQRLLQSEAA